MLLFGTLQERYNLAVSSLYDIARGAIGGTLRWGIVAGLISVATASLTGCGNGSKPVDRNIGPSHVVKVKVNREGLIWLNDQPVTIDELKTSLVKASQSPGSAVWYYREDAAGEAHPNAMLVLNSIVESKLPVRMSTRPDFSDSVGPDGSSHPPQ